MGFLDIFNPFKWFGGGQSGTIDPIEQRQRFFEQQEQLYNTRRPPGSPSYRDLLTMGVRPPMINPLSGMPQNPSTLLGQTNNSNLLPSFNANVNNVSVNDLGNPDSELMALLGTTDNMINSMQQSLAAQRANGQRPAYA